MIDELGEKIMTCLTKSKKLQLLNTVTAEGFSETIPFMHLSKHIFRSQ